MNIDQARKTLRGMTTEERKTFCARHRLPFSTIQKFAYGYQAYGPRATTMERISAALERRR